MNTYIAFHHSMTENIFINPRNKDARDQGSLLNYSLGQHKKFTLFLDQLRKDFYNRYNNVHDMNTRTISDFHFEKTLGTGAYGRVYLCRDKKANQFNAIKVMEKKKILELDQIEHALDEKNIQLSLRFPFLVHLKTFFKDNVYLYMVMPFVPGGELFTHLRKFGSFSEILTKFYASQIVLAFEYLHHCDLVYRDLKPENILVAEDGYIKLTDFGFCKVVRGRTWTLCGTPEYLAPEVILSRGYGKAVDWWALGIIIYELASGYPPFFANNQVKIYEKILDLKYKIPANFSEDLKDLLKGLIQSDVTKRLGTMKMGSFDIKSHDWFHDVNWDAIMHHRVEPPFRPAAVPPGDTTNFETYDESILEKSSKCRFEDEFKDF